MDATMSNQQAGIQAAELAGQEHAIGHLSAMVDELRNLLGTAMKAMKALESAAVPDESTEDMDARIPANDFRRFVDARASLLGALARSPHGGQLD
jgi:hypothetical protein